MQKHQIRSVSDALSYLVDCQLATVACLAMKKSRGAYDYNRHVKIAKTGVEMMREFNVCLDGNRAAQVVSQHNGSVSAWAKTYESET